MFDYRKFKKDMNIRDHKVTKNGNIITIVPENGTRGFLNAYELVTGYENYLNFKDMSHYNTHIYSARFNIPK